MGGFGVVTLFLLFFYNYLLTLNFTFRLKFHPLPDKKLITNNGYWALTINYLFNGETMMIFLEKRLVLVVLFFSLTFSVPVFAYDCVLGSVGHCIWAGFDKKDSKNVNLINPTSFLTLCKKYEIHCSTYNNDYNSIMGRYLNNDLFIISGKGWGGPDLIMDNQRQAEQFSQDFKNISYRPNTYYYVKNDSNPARKAVVIGYKEKNRDGHEEIKLLMLPNQWEDNGNNYAYIPPDR